MIFFQILGTVVLGLVLFSFFAIRALKKVEKMYLDDKVEE
jgi:hypothetical protein